MGGTKDGVSRGVNGHDTEYGVIVQDTQHGRRWLSIEAPRTADSKSHRIGSMMTVLRFSREAFLSIAAKFLREPTRK